jgi:hypothetical protein
VIHTLELIASSLQDTHSLSLELFYSSYGSLRIKAMMIQPGPRRATMSCVASRRGLGSVVLRTPGYRFNNGFKAHEVRPSSTTAFQGGKDTTTQTLPQTKPHYPLATMPTNMLLRSLFIATVSSNKFLLIPCLHLLSFFSKPGRSYFFNVDRNPALKAILKRTLYNQFCAGETEQETRALVKQLKNLGFKGVILTYAKEMVFDHKNKSANHHATEEIIEKHVAVAHDADIETWRTGTLKTLDLISEGDILALK